MFIEKVWQDIARHTCNHIIYLRPLRNVGEGYPVILLNVKFLKIRS